MYIVNLKFDSIDWDTCELRLVQEKTNLPISLPLDTKTGNAIANYILHARPKCKSEYVFLRVQRPYTKLGRMWTMIAKYAHIALGKGRKMNTLTTGCRQGTVEVCPVKNPIKSDPARNIERTGKLGAPMHTLTTKDRHGVLCEGRIRRLTPRECLRLQGWTDDRIDTVLAIQSDNQAYKQAGNGVTVNVVEAIGRRIAKMDAELRGEQTAP